MVHILTSVLPPILSCSLYGLAYYMNERYYTEKWPWIKVLQHLNKYNCPFIRWHSTRARSPYEREKLCRIFTCFRIHSQK